MNADERMTMWGEDAIERRQLGGVADDLNETGVTERQKELDGITARIIGCAYQVSKCLGSGFLEKVYENALSHELKRGGMQVERQVPIEVYYDDIVAGEFCADLLVERAVLVELKSICDLTAAHVAQCMNYLTATRLTVCLLLNFGKPRVQVKRVVRNF